MADLLSPEVMEKFVEQSPFAAFCLIVIVILSISHHKSKKLLERSFEKSLREIRETYKSSMLFVEKMTKESRRKGA